MDYGTMKKKLESGEYRSAQAMQKDFILVMQNCLQFNSSDSDIVKEARRQALRFPSLLKSAALKHNLFLAEDGSVLHVQSEDEDEYKDVEEGDAKPGRRGRKKKKAPAKRKYTRKSPALPRRSKKDKRGESSADLKDKPAPKKRGRKKKKVPVKEIEVSDYSNSEKSDDNDTSDSETKDSPAPKAKKPRIRISLNSTSDKTTGSAKRISKKRTRKTLDEQEKTSKGDDIDSDSQGEPSRSKSKVNEEDVVPIASEKIPKRKRKVVPPKPDLPKKKASDTDLEDGEIDDTDTKEKNEVKQSLKSPDDTISDEKNNANDEIDETDDPGKKHADITTIKKELGSLDGSLADVKQFVTRRGPWILPKSVSVDKWYTVAKFTLTKMKKHDGYRLFADKVTDDDAPGYSDVIKKPMDFKTMSDKLEEGSYGEGSEALTKLYSDYLLVFDNCAIYNDVGSEVADEAARVMKLLPEVFANACASVREKGKRGRKKKSKI